MNHPNFFILGAQKTATTYLAAVLSRHPNVLFSTPKEIFFFDKSGLSLDKYEAYCNKYYMYDKQRIGEGSTTYLQSPNAPINIKTFVSGNPLFIICLRHPLEKAVSFFIHNWRRGRYSDSENILNAGSSNKQFSPFFTSIYSEAIQVWLQAFSYQKSRFLFLQQEHLCSNRKDFILQATNFLGISESTYETKNIVNPGLPFVVDNSSKALIFQKPVSDLEGVNSVVIPFSDLEKLHSKLLHQKNKVEDLIGQDLSHWSEFPYKL